MSYILWVVIAGANLGGYNHNQQAALFPSYAACKKGGEKMVAAITAMRTATAVTAQCLEVGLPPVGEEIRR